MSLLMERIRLRDSSDNKIMPCALSYSSRCTYAPISCMDVTCMLMVGNGWPLLRQGAVLRADASIPLS